MPNYHLAPVEVFLTGRSAEVVKENPRNGKVLAEAEDYQAVVVTVSDELTASLAEASSERLAEAAESWSHFEDFQGTDTSGLVGFLGDLASLARRAGARNEHLYCRLCVLRADTGRRLVSFCRSPLALLHVGASCRDVVAQGEIHVPSHSIWSEVNALTCIDPIQ